MVMEGMVGCSMAADMVSTTAKQQRLPPAVAMGPSRPLPRQQTPPKPGTLPQQVCAVCVCVCVCVCWTTIFHASCTGLLKLAKSCSLTLPVTVDIICRVYTTIGLHVQLFKSVKKQAVKWDQALRRVHNIRNALRRID